MQYKQHEGEERSSPRHYVARLLGGSTFISIQYPKAFATASIRMINYSCCDPGDKTHIVRLSFLLGVILGLLKSVKPFQLSNSKSSLRHCSPQIERYSTNSKLSHIEFIRYQDIKTHPPTHTCKKLWFRVMH